MAVDAFLKIAGIPGESTDSKHKDEIELLSFSWGVNQQGRTGAGAAGGKANIEDFAFIHSFDKASPLLYLAACQGQQINLATFTARKAGKEQLEFLVIKMSDCIVTSVAPGGSTGSEAAPPIEEVHLNFAKIEIDYKPQKPDGSAGESVQATCGAHKT